jgi:tRNA (guanine6-N2)-methyltransferase
VLVRTLRGIESVAAGEIRERLGVRSVDSGHRELRFELPQLTRELLELGTADDAFLVVHDGPPTGHRRPDLEQLRLTAHEIDLDATARDLAAVRAVEGRSFDVSASFLGRRNYSRYEIEDTVGDTLGAASGWSYRSRSVERPTPGDLSLRVHLTQERTTVAVRVAARPLHRRGYRVASRPGALHPPLARALALLATPRGSGVLLDPFCGTGTIPIESKLAYPRIRAVGSDVDRAAIEAAQENAAAAAVSVELAVSDAGRLQLPDDAVDSVATNPPWALRVPAVAMLRSGFERFWPELARVLRPGGRAALLVPQDETVPPGLEVVQRFPVRVSGAVVDVVVLARG